MADAAKTAGTAEQLKVQIEELKAQGEADRIEFELKLAGCRNVKAARKTTPSVPVVEVCASAPRIARNPGFGMRGSDFRPRFSSRATRLSA